VASYAVRTAANDQGELSLSGLTPNKTQNIWTLCADFTPAIGVGDVLKISTYPAAASEVCFVENAMQTSGLLVCRATVVLCTDTVTIDGQDCFCDIAGVQQDVMQDIGGFTPSETQGFFIPVSSLPDPGKMIETGDSVAISGAEYSVEKVSLSHNRLVACVTCSRRGAAKNG
jgi:hypothetical protein